MFMKTAMLQCIAERQHKVILLPVIAYRTLHTATVQHVSAILPTASLHTAIQLGV